jgi:hypothetical protein
MLTWFTHVNDKGRQEPCMVLVDAGRTVSAKHTMPVVIYLDNAWRFAVSEDPRVGDRLHTKISITEWIDTGMLSGTFINILSAINENLRDLYNMPPKPPFIGDYAIGDIIIKDRLSGSVLSETEMKNNV